MKKRVILLILVSFLTSVFSSHYLYAQERTIIESLSSNKYGLEEETFLTQIAEKFNKIKIDELDQIKELDRKLLDDVIDDLKKYVNKYRENELTQKAEYLLSDCYEIKGINLLLNNAQKEEYSAVLLESILKRRDIQKKNILPSFYMQNLEYRIAETYFILGDLRKSFDGIRKYPYNYLSSDVYYLLSIIYINFLINKTESNISWDSIKSILQSIKTNTNLEIRLKTTLGIACFFMNNFNDAIDNLKNVEDEDAKYFLAKTYEKIGKYLLAVGEYRYILNNFPNTKYKEKLYISIANNFYDLKQYNFAIDAYQQYLKLYPNSEYSAYALYKTGISYYLSQDHLKAIEFLNEVLSFKEYKKSSIDINKIKLYAEYMIGYSYYVMQDYLKAIDVFKNVGTKYREEFEGIKAVYMAGLCYYNLKKYNEAENLLKDRLNNLLVEDINYMQLYYLLGGVQFKKGDIDSAAITYQLLVNKIRDAKLENLRDQAFFMLIWITYSKENYQRIVSEFQFLIYQLMPNMTKNAYRMRAYFLVADSCYRIGYFGEARKLFNDIAKEYVRDDVIYSKVLDGLAWCDFKEKNYLLAGRNRTMIKDIIGSTTQDLGEIKYLNAYELGNIFFNQKQYNKSIENFEDFLKNVPQNNSLIPEALNRLGDTYYRAEYYSIAIQKWDEILKKYPQYSKALDVGYKIADTYYKSGVYDKAVGAFEYIVANFDKNNPKVIEASIRIPQSYYNAMKFDDAIREFKKFVRRYPNTKKTKEAIDLIEATIFRAQEYKAFLEGKKVVDTSIAQEMENQLKDLFEENLKNQLITDIVFRLAKNYYDEGDYVNAAKWYSRFFLEGSYSSYDKEIISSTQYQLAESNYNIKKFNEAINGYLTILKNFPDFKEQETLYIKLATAYLNIKEYQKAVEYYSIILQRYPHASLINLVYYNTGICYKELNDFVNAGRMFNSYYQLNQNDENAIQIMFEIGEMYIKNREYTGAIILYAGLLQGLKAENKIYAQYKIAECYEKQFKTTEAINEYKQLINLEPLDDQVRLSGIIKLAELLQEAKQYDQAVNYYNAVLKVTDNQNWISALKARIDEIEYITSSSNVKQ